MDNPKRWEKRSIDQQKRWACPVCWWWTEQVWMNPPTQLHFPVTFDSARWDNVQLMGQKQDKYLLFRPGCLPSKSLHYLTSPLIWQESEKATHWLKLVSDRWSWEARLYVQFSFFHFKLWFLASWSVKDCASSRAHILSLSAGSGIEFGIRRSVNLSRRWYVGAILVPSWNMSRPAVICLREHSGDAVGGTWCPRWFH